MIKGAVNTNDHRFGDITNSFIKSLSIINLKYKVTEVKDVGVVKKHLEIEFNNFKNIKFFSNDLGRDYNNAINEIEEILLIKLKKYDRLKFILDLILKFNDVQKLLINASGTDFKHANFNISNSEKFKGKLIGESYCQEYYAKINEYLDKMKAYLELQKDIQGMMSDSDIPLHYFNVPAEDESTKENPLNFFNYLINKNVIFSLLNQFKPSKDDFSRNDIDYEDDTKTITYNHYDVEKRKHSTTKRTFNDYFIKRLKAELKKSRRLIKEHFNDLKTKLEASFFFELTLNDLQSLVKNAKSDKNAIGYADIIKPINALIKHIKSEYTVFIKPEEFKDKEPKAFILYGIKDAANDLHDSLELKGYLHKDCKEDFIKLFTGQQLVNKITWIGNKNELKLFINLLIREERIKKCNSKKWQITAANFKFKDGGFKARQIKDFKPPKDKSIIEGIVSKIRY